MKMKLNLTKNIMILAALLGIIFLIINKLILDREKVLLEELYNSNIKSINYKINTLIEDKKNTNTVLAITISQDYKIISFLENSNLEKIKYDKLLNDLKKKTNYKNVWIEIFDKNSNLMYQSWNNKPLLKNSKKQVQNIEEVIEVNEYDLSFVTRVPIFNEHEYLGYLNLSTKFNSIQKALEKENILSVALVNKQTSEKIVYPFSKNFYKKHYVANKDVKPEVLTYLDKLDLESFTNFQVKKNNLIGSYKVKDLANIYYFKDLAYIDSSSISSYKFNTYFLLLSFIFLILLLYVIFFYVFNFRKVKYLHKKLKDNMKLTIREKTKVKSLLDSQSSIILITNGIEIKRSNKKLLEFYECENLEVFKQRYNCICSSFEEYGEDYVLEKDYDGKNWAELILANPDKSFKAAIYNKHKELKHFSVKVVEDKAEKLMIVTLSDITKEVKYQLELKNFNEKLEKTIDEKTSQLKDLNENLEFRIKKEIEINRQKDKIIFEQNKMASISELLNNIAHHWRQPLSVISTVASAIKLQKQFNALDDKFLDDSCEHIMEKTQYLSDTIDSFTKLFNKNEKLELRSLEKLINSSIDYLKTILNENAIHLHTEIEDKDIVVFENDFKQAILHILHNSIKALNENVKDGEKLIIIKFENNQLSIQDNAHGMSENMIGKIFEPYFTTYHKSSGKGLGLYYVKEILLKSMDYTIEAYNCSFHHNENEYRGLKFVIKKKV